MSRQRPLSSPQHERALLGALFSDSQSLALVRGVLAEPHFTSTEAVTVWASLCEQWDAGIEISSAVVANALERKGFQDSYDFIGSCINEFSDPSDVEALAEILEDWRLRRHLHEVGKRLVRKAGAWEGDARQLLTLAQQHLSEADLRCSGPVGRDLSEAATSLWVHMQTPAIERRDAFLMTGLPQLDRVLFLHKGTLGVIAGRRSNGKSSLAQQIALFNANLGRRVAFRSLEMTREELVMRAVAQLHKIPLEIVIRAYRGEDCSSEMLALIRRALDDVGRLPLIIEDSGPSDIGSILGWASRLHAYAPLDLFVLDYLGLVRSRSGGRKDNRRGDIDEASAEVKAWAKARRVAAIALSQVTDATPGQRPERPMEGQARDSRDVEDHADWYLATHLPGRYATDQQKAADPMLLRMAELNLIKQRNGWTGPLSAGWDGATTRFLPIAT